MVSKVYIYTAIAIVIVMIATLCVWHLSSYIVKVKLKKTMALSNKTDTRRMWEKMPFAVDFKIYLFNYTNPEEIQRGGIPVVEEIGPYYFEDWKEKIDISDNEEDDTITYRKLDTFYFRPNLSGPGLTGEEMITIPHVFMLGSAITVAREKPTMLNVVGKALNGIFDDPSDIFLRANVMDILFRGIMINCAKTDFAPKALCSQLKKDPPRELILEPNDQYRFSFFGKKNNTADSKVVTIKRGIKNITEVGSVVAIDDQSKQNIWRDTCNQYVGTDGTVFPPFMTEADRLSSFLSDFCRPFKPWYQKKTSYKGIKTNHYIANMGDLASDPELNCFCDAPDKCPPKGLMDMHKCIGAPLYISMPHFLDGDPKLLERVKGLNPDFEQHAIEIDFEPLSGTLMVAKQRIQFNIQLMQSEKMELFKHLSNDIVPLFWIEEGIALNKTYVNLLKYQLFLPKRIINALCWWFISIGGFALLGIIIFIFRDIIWIMAIPNHIKAAVTNEEEESKQKNEGQQKDISFIGEPTKINM